LQRLVEDRRHFVDEKVALTNTITAALKSYYPQVLQWFGDIDTPLFCDFLLQFSTLDKAQGETATTLMKAGVDDQSLIDFIKYKYSDVKAGEDGKRPGFAEWLPTFKTENTVLFTAAEQARAAAAAANGAGAKADAKAGATAQPTGAATGATTGAAPRDTTQNGVIPAVQPIGKPLSPAEIARLSPEEFKAHMPTLLSGLK